jgi:uncharacterized protein (TIRG00374 family)
MDITNTLAQISDVDLTNLMLSAVFILCYGALFSLRYKLLLKDIGHEIKFIQSLAISQMSAVINYIIPLKAGVLSKPLLTKKFSDCSFKKSVFALFLEQFFEIGFQILFVLIIFLLLGQDILLKNKIFMLIFAIIISGFFTILALLFHRDTFIRLYLKTTNMLPEKIREKLKKKIPKKKLEKILEACYNSTSNHKLILRFGAITLIMVILSPMILTSIIRATNNNLSFSAVFFIYWSAIILGRITFLPGGLGTRDVIMTALLTQFGIGFAESIKITVVYRITTWTVSLGMGLIFLVFYSKEFGTQARDFMKGKIKKIRKKHKK